MTKSKLVTAILAFVVFLFFAGVAAIAIIISRGGAITDDGFVFESGVVRVQTEPASVDATYYLNDEEIDLQDRRINGLTEGEYKIRIEAEGYASWEKTFEVTSGIVVDVYARLYPTKFAVEQLTNTNIERAFFSDNGEFVYYLVVDSPFGTNKGLWRIRLTQNQFLFNTLENSPEKLANLDAQIAATITGDDYELIPSFDNNRLLLHDRARNKHFILSANEFNEAPLEVLDKVLGFVPDSVNWFNGSNSLIIQDGSLLFEYSLSSRISTVIAYRPKGNIVSGTSNNAVMVFDDLTQELQLYQNQTRTDLSLENVAIPKVMSEIHMPVNNERFIIFKSGNFYYYLDTEKSLLKKIEDKELTFHSIAQDGRAALFMKGERVFSYTVREVVATDSVKTILRDTGFSLTGENDIIAFVPQSTHIIHYANSNVHQIRVADRDGTNKITLLNDPGIRNADFSVDSDGNTFLVLLEDEVSQNQEISRANLYALDLENPQAAQTEE